MTITEDEIAAETRRLAAAHGVDPDRMTDEQVERVRAGLNRRKSEMTTVDQVVLRALGEAWLSGDKTTGKAIAERAGCADSTANHAMQRMARRGILVRVGTGVTNCTYIPKDLHDRVAKEAE